MDSPTPRVSPVIPERVETVYVLSRVTLGADIKITGMVLDCMTRRFPGASIVLVSGRKSIDLFSADSRIRHIEADYPLAPDRLAEVASSSPPRTSRLALATARTPSSSIPIRA